MSRFKYTEDEVLEDLRYFDITAYQLLKEELPTAERRFKRLTTGLRKLLEDVREVFPDAEYYTASGGFNLLLGRSHDDKMKPQQELNALGAIGLDVGDGDW